MMALARRLAALCRALVVLAALVIACAPGPAGAAAHDEARDLVRSAQAAFESGRDAFGHGLPDAARKDFERCHELLLQADEGADEAADESLQRRIDRIFNRFYKEMADLDPATAAEFRAIREQVGRTYRAQPVYAGQVQYHIRYLAEKKHAFLVNSFQRSLRYIPMISSVFEQAGIPPDLAYMALIESGFRPDPTSCAGAKGLWQFIPSTARGFGLRVDDEVDERLDPVKSTHAAAAYLKLLHAMFGDWPLAVAAYNCGQGRVRRALQTSGSTTYWELVDRDALPVETQRYVPSIIAATIISRDPGRYGLPPVVPN